MPITYDYQELIDELKDEVGTGSLTKDEVIQVLRSDKSDKEGYAQILDWYYNDATLTIELEPDPEDSKEDAKDKLLLREQYLEDKEQLEQISVEAVLEEIMSRTIQKSKKNTRNPFF